MDTHEPPVPSKQHIAACLGMANNPNASPEARSRAETEVMLAAERGSPEKSKNAVEAQINTATKPDASNTKKHLAREALMSEGGKSSTKD